jgi:thiol-disulfide isomerase/thioredoxin
MTLVLGACALLGGVACGHDDGTPQKGPVPFSFRVVDLSGVQAALDEGEPKGTLVNFWATWCVPCVEEMPELAEVARAYRERGLRVLTISVDYVVPGQPPTPDEVRRFAERAGWGLDVLYFQDAEHEGLDEAFDLPGSVPVTLALDAQGREVDRSEDKTSKERFEELALAALGTGHAGAER